MVLLSDVLLCLDFVSEVGLVLVDVDLEASLLCCLLQMYSDPEVEGAV
jgi:hypothetical protein